MKIYFLSSQPCSLRLNGVFYGATDDFERFAELHLTDRIFVEFTPEGAHSVSFFLTEEILTAPPIGCEVYLIREGVVIRAYDFPPIDCTLHPIAQNRFGDTVISVFQQGRIQCTMQTPNSFFTSTLPPAFSLSTLSKHGDFYFIEGKNALAVYTNNGERVFLEEILSFSASETEFNASLPLSNALGRVADCTYALDKTGCRRTRFSLRQAYAHDGDTNEEKIRDELLPYTFFERVLLGENYAELLSTDLQYKAKHIVDFLGDFHQVSLTDSPYTCGLIKEKAPRLFEVAYFTVTVEGGKITDIKG